MWLGGPKTLLKGTCFSLFCFISTFFTVFSGRKPELNTYSLNFEISILEVKTNCAEFWKICRLKVPF